MPCLGDRFEEGGATGSEYFWQDLLVARWVYEAAPVRHVDVGSRIDGFVAHVASFREIEVFDVRAVTANIPGVRFTRADLMNRSEIEGLIGVDGYCDSISCLHALEHFGLGRYGDQLDCKGYELGLANLAALLKPKGRLYLATPFGRQRVEFNANWIFSPHTILGIAQRYGLRLERLLVFQPNVGFVDCPSSDFDVAAGRLATEAYHLVVMQYSKT
jgi:hypothetical protein